MSQQILSRGLRVAAVVVALVGGNGVAMAQPAAAPPAATPAADAVTAEAKRHFQQAVALYNDGNFEAALAEFLASQRTKPAPSLLYNIGLTYKALFLYNDAIRSLESYLREDTKIAPERRAEVEQILREMQALLAPTQLAISPDGAIVKLDGRTVGRAPIGQYLIAAGRHVLEVSFDGYVQQTKELMVTAGVPLAISIALQVIPKTGRVRISTRPDGSSIKLDGRTYPPPVDLELPLGGHTLEVWATGYQVHREELLIAPGQTREISVSLRRPPLGKRAAFLVPVVIGSVLLATGIGLGIGCGALHGCEDKLLSGTLAPGNGSVGK